MDYLEDFLVGQTIETGYRTITETDIVQFCMFSGDWYPLHSDVEFAESSVFGGRIAHGMLVLSVATGLIPLTDMAIIAFYGMDSVRFVKPVRIGDSVGVKLEVRDKRAKEENGLVTLKCEVRNRKKENVVIGDLTFLVASREMSTSSHFGS